MTEKACCRKCAEDKIEPNTGIPLALTQIIICSQCGDKRCPKADDHNNYCYGQQH